MNDQPFQRPVSLVTGAGRGIGRGIAIELAKLGHTVIINYAGNSGAAEECLQLVRSAGGDGIVVRADISSSIDRKQLVGTVIDQFERIDLLVNNAGVAPTVRADLLEAGEESFDRLININLKGPYFLSQLVALRMVEQVKSGNLSSMGLPRIVNISSVSGYAPSINRGDYCISKAGIAMMTALYAARLAEYGINVYEIRPGIIATDMTAGVKAKYDKMIEEGAWPIRRWGEPEDVGRAVASIARGDFPFSTGEVINVDGGYHLRIL
jgi:3-oxoacyl-[acyl-carrier protein] reductase